LFCIFEVGHSGDVRTVKLVRWVDWRRLDGIMRKGCSEKFLERSEV
jgi:hypothetical protein